MTREWRGRIERVMALEEGFAWNGKTFASLSGVALAITGVKWSGQRFFFGGDDRSSRSDGRSAGGGKPDSVGKPDSAGKPSSAGNSSAAGHTERVGWRPRPSAMAEGAP